MEPNPLQDQSKDRKMKPPMLTSVKKGFLEGRWILIKTVSSSKSVWVQLFLFDSIKAIFLKFLTFLTTKNSCRSYQTTPNKSKQS